MEELDWNTPPTEEEVKSVSWDTPPTEEEMSTVEPTGDMQDEIDATDVTTEPTVTTPTPETIDQEESKYAFTKDYAPQQYVTEIETSTNEALKILKQRATEASTPEEKLALDRKALLIKKEAKDAIDQFEPQMPNIFNRVQDEVTAGLTGLGLETAQVANFLTRNAADVSNYILSRITGDTEGAMKGTGYEGVLSKQEKALTDIGGELTKEHEAQYGEDAMEVGKFIGQNALDFAVGGAVVKPAKVALSEFLLSGARNNTMASEDVSLFEKAKAISSDTLLAYTGAKLLNKFLPDTQRTELETLGKKIKDPKARENFMQTVDELDKLNIQSLDDTARLKVVGAIQDGTIKNQEQVSSMIRGEVLQAKTVAREAKDAAYKSAKEIAKDTSTKRFSLDDEDAMNRYRKFIREDEWSTNKNTKAMIKDFKKEFLQKSGGNANDLENLRQAYLGKAADTNNPNKQRMYNKMVDFIDGETDKLFPKGENPYTTARELHSDYVNKFKKGASGFDAKNAKIFDEMLDSPQYVGEAERIFKSNLDVNAVKSFKKVVGSDDKKLYDATVSMIMNDVADPASQEGLDMILKNYSKMSNDGLKEMLGTNGYNQLKARMRGVEMIKTAIDGAEDIGTTLKKDILDFASAGLLAKVSPYVSARIAVSSGGRIIEKATGGSRSKIVKQLAQYKKTADVRKVLQGLMLVGINNKGD